MLVKDAIAKLFRADPSGGLTARERRFVVGIVLLLVFGLALRAYYRLAPRARDFATPAASAAAAPLGKTQQQPAPAVAAEADVGQVLVEELVP